MDVIYKLNFRMGFRRRRTINDIAQRSELAFAAVLPPLIQIRRGLRHGNSVDLYINGKGLRVAWLGEGGLRQARELVSGFDRRPDVAAARRMSPGARTVLSAAGIGWVDETGAAEIVTDSLIVSRSGRPVDTAPKQPKWTPSVLAVAEALLCGTRATVTEIKETTGLSTGAATNALRTLVEFDLLEGSASRGRNAARRVRDPERLLAKYAAFAVKPTISLTVGVTWRDFLEKLCKIGRQWDRAKIEWAATGTVAASVLAPYLTTVSTGVVYVDSKTISGIESIANRADLRPMQGGRLILRPFPTVTSKRLAVLRQDLRVVPWPCVYADLRIVGVRGEEAAEHLREVVCG